MEYILYNISSAKLGVAASNASLVESAGIRAVRIFFIKFTLRIIRVIGN